MESSPTGIHRLHPSSSSTPLATTTDSSVAIVATTTVVPSSSFSSASQTSSVAQPPTDTCIHIYAREANSREVKKHLLFGHYSILAQSEYFRQNIKNSEKNDGGELLTSTTDNNNDTSQQRHQHRYELYLDLSMVPDALNTFQTFIKSLYNNNKPNTRVENAEEEGASAEALAYLAKLCGSFMSQGETHLGEKQHTTDMFVDQQQLDDEFTAAGESSGTSLSSSVASAGVLNNVSNVTSCSSPTTSLLPLSISNLLTTQQQSPPVEVVNGFNASPANFYAAYLQLQSLIARGSAQQQQPTSATSTDPHHSPTSAGLMSPVVDALPRPIPLFNEAGDGNSSLSNHYSSNFLDSLKQQRQTLNSWIASADAKAMVMDQQLPPPAFPQFVNIKATSAENSGGGGKILNRKGSSSSFSPSNSPNSSSNSSATMITNCSGSNNNNNSGLGTGILVPTNDKEGWCRNKKYIQIVKKGYRCLVCNKVYGRYNSVSYHVTIYHRNPPIRCEEEGCQFTTREARYIHFHKYYRHQIALPDSIDLASRKCPLAKCKHVSKSPAMLEKHIHRHVTDCFKNGVYYCCMELISNNNTNSSEEEKSTHAPTTAMNNPPNGDLSGGSGRVMCAFSTGSHETMYGHLIKSHVGDSKSTDSLSPPAATLSLVDVDGSGGAAIASSEPQDMTLGAGRQQSQDNNKHLSQGRFQCELCSYKGRTLANLEQHKLFKHSKQLFNLSAQSNTTNTFGQQQQATLLMQNASAQGNNSAASDFQTSPFSSMNLFHQSSSSFDSSSAGGDLQPQQSPVGLTSNFLESLVTAAVTSAAAGLFPGAAVTSALTSQLFSNAFHPHHPLLHHQHPLLMNHPVVSLGAMMPILTAGSGVVHPSSPPDAASSLLTQLAAAQRVASLLSFAGTSTEKSML